jgi:hypothetical protein
MDGMEDEEVLDVKHKMGTVKTVKPRQAIRIVNRTRLMKLNEGY